MVSKATASGLVMLVSMAALVAIGAMVSYQILKGDHAKRTKALEDEYAALKAELLQRMEDMIEKPPSLRLVKSAYGERIIVRFGLDPDLGRVRIDWTLKPEQRQPLRVQLFVGPQKLLCSEFALAAISTGTGHRANILCVFAPAPLMPRMGVRTR